MVGRRAREEPWGFTLPPDTPSPESLPRILTELDGLNARLEANCLWKVAGEDPPEARTRAFQHLAEVRALMERLREVFRIVAMANSFERAPWIRAMIIGCAIPGSGDKLRAGVARFANMGYAPGPSAHAASRPGGLPVHAFLKTVVLPEKDLVPLRTRWRDDRLIVIALIVGIVLLFAAAGADRVFFLSRSLSGAAYRSTITRLARMTAMRFGSLRVASLAFAVVLAACGGNVVVDHGSGSGGGHGHGG